MSTPERRARSYAGDNSLYPAASRYAQAVTTIVTRDLRLRSFDDFKQRIIDRSRTRVLRFSNRRLRHASDKFEQNWPT